MPRVRPDAVDGQQAGVAGRDRGHNPTFQDLSKFSFLSFFPRARAEFGRVENDRFSAARRHLRYVAAPRPLSVPPALMYLVGNP